MMINLGGMELPLFEIISIALRKNMNNEVLDGDGRAFFQVGKVGMFDMMTIEKDY